MYNLIEYSDNCFKKSEGLWQYFRDEPAIEDDGVIIDFNEANPTKFFNSKARMTGQTGNNGRKGVEIIMPLKYHH